MSGNIKEQVVDDIDSTSFGLLSIQLDELIDVKSCFQFVGFRYIAVPDQTILGRRNNFGRIFSTIAVVMMSHRCY